MIAPSVVPFLAADSRPSRGSRRGACRWKTASGGLSGFRHPRAHSNPRPTGVCAMKPAEGLTQSVMDKLDYGLSEPQLVLLQDGSWFLAGQVQQPMDPPVLNNPQAMRRGMAADLTNVALTTGMTLMGTGGTTPPLISIACTSDHKVLGPVNDGNVWSDSWPQTYGGQVWFWTKPNTINPISQTKGTKLTLTAQVYLGNKLGDQYTLTGTGPHGYSTFTGTKAANGKLQNITLTANAPLPSSVAALSESIRWTLTGPSVTQNVGTTAPFRIYVTYDKPIDTKDAHGFRKGCDATESRMKWCCQTASGESTIDGIANKLYDKMYPQNSLPVFGYFGDNKPAIASTTPYLWSLLTDSTRFGDCISMAYLMQMQALMLGVPASRGYVYASDVLPNPPTSCYTDWDADNPDKQYRTRPCPASSTHGKEELWFYAPYKSINRWEGVCKIADTFYAVKELKTQYPFEMIQKFIGKGTFSGPDGPVEGPNGDHFQVWRYYDDFGKLQDCILDHYPQPLP